jgi:hypothetical protein
MVTPHAAQSNLKRRFEFIADLQANYINERNVRELLHFSLSLSAPPAEQAAARDDQAGKASSNDRPRHGD